jgi:hypothetical protein
MTELIRSASACVDRVWRLLAGYELVTRQVRQISAERADVAANPGLIRKNYLYDAEKRRAGGVYLWRTMEAARRARDAAWLERARRTYGSEPSVQYLETPLVADNVIGQIIDEAGTVTSR